MTSESKDPHDGYGDRRWPACHVIVPLDGRSTIIEFAAPSGFGPPLHIHHREDEAFYVLKVR